MPKLLFGVKWMPKVILTILISQLFFINSIFSFEIVQKAWVPNPEQRPMFSELVPYLESLRGRPEYQVDCFQRPSITSFQSNSPYPSNSSFGLSNSPFEQSLGSTSGSNGGSLGRTDKQEFGRFDKSGKRCL